MSALRRRSWPPRRRSTSRASCSYKTFPLGVEASRSHPSRSHNSTPPFTLTVSVRRLPHGLPGEREGRCPPGDLLCSDLSRISAENNYPDAQPADCIVKGGCVFST